MPKFANFVLFQCVWIVTVLGAAQGVIWPGIASLAFFLTVHAFLSESARTDYLVCILAIALGLVIESINAKTGLIVHPVGDSLFPPLWIIILWCNLGLIFNNSVSWLLDKPLLAALLGAAGGTVSYIGGVAIGAASFGVPLETAAPALAITWAIVTPLLFYATRRLNGFMTVKYAG